MAARWDLAVALTIREIVVRYKRSVFGLGWALAEPLVNVAVYSVVFGRFLGAWGEMPSYALYTMMGMLPWIFFSSSLEQSTLTLLEHAPLIRKVAFPRELLIVAVVVSRLTTLLAGILLALVLAALKSASGTDFAWERAFMIPVGIVSLTLLSLGASLVLSALQVVLRDIAFLVRFALRLGFFACPIIYTVARVPSEWRGLYELNPLVGVLWCFQAMVAPAGIGPSAVSMVVGIGFSFAVAAAGWWAFRRLEPIVADRV